MPSHSVDFLHVYLLCFYCFLFIYLFACIYIPIVITHFPNCCACGLRLYQFTRFCYCLFLQSNVSIRRCTSTPFASVRFVMLKYFASSDILVNSQRIYIYLYSQSHAILFYENKNRNYYCQVMAKQHF